jgi:lysophospholipid acyltransferase (LPLAT)-like uncharacterized protein
MMGWLLRILVVALGSTLRYEMVDPAGLLAATPTEPVIFAFWHNRIFLMPYLFRTHWKKRSRTRVAVLVSASKDGEKLARVLNRFNLICVRGSSSRRGKEALRELTRLVEDGYDAGITPDGPRGPRYEVHSGVIDLAALTGARIVPISYALSRAITFKSWDAFMVPLPFARCTVRMGPLLSVPRDADDATREDKRLELQRILQNLSEP